MEAHQEPRLRVKPKSPDSSGEAAGYLGSRYGLTPDDWQQRVLDDWLGETKSGKLTAGTVGLSVPRQNGKNAILEVVELYKLAIQGRKILHTAHEVKTARKAFLRLAGFFENERRYPELAELVSKNGIRKANGQEAIYLHNGGSVEFVARTRGSGRGFTVDDLICDEAQELTDEQLESLLPTISAAPSGDPQQIYTGTPPGPRSVGTVFPRLRRQATGGKAKRLCWCEWSIPDDMRPEDAMKSWRKHAYAVNPALGGRLGESTLTDEMSTMSVEGFCRERLGWWESERSGLQAVDPKQWDACKIKPSEAPRAGKVVYGIRFSSDGSSIGLAAARSPGGSKPVHVEAVRIANMGEGTQWLVDWLAERHRKAAQIVVDGRYGVEFLVNALRDAGVRNKRLVIRPTLDQVKAAHLMMDQAIRSADVTTIHDDTVEQQVLSSQRRELGKEGGFGWQAPEGGSVVLFEAMTYALWGAKVTKRNPKGERPQQGKPVERRNDIAIKPIRPSEVMNL